MFIKESKSISNMINELRIEIITLQGRLNSVSTNIYSVLDESQVLFEKMTKLTNNLALLDKYETKQLEKETKKLFESFNNLVKTISNHTNSRIN